MKYTTSIEINLTRDKVLDFFDNPENLYKWQPDLKSFELLSGEPGQNGTISKLTYAFGNRNMEMTETITNRNFPEVYTVEYKTKGVKNIVVNKFIEQNDSITLWITENEFKFTGFMAIMSLFMMNAFKKQTLKTMNQFKQFVEDQKMK